MIIFNHRFPIDNAALLEKLQWKETRFPPQKVPSFCSDHFLESDCSYPSTLPLSATLKKRKLKQNAVPSIFDFPAHLKKQPVKERNPNKRVSQALHLHSLSEHSSPKKPKFDHTYASNASTTKLKAEFTKRLKKKNPIIYNLRRKNLRREKTIKGLMFRL